MTRKTVLLWCYWGPEVRLIVYSGLIRELLIEYDVVLLSRVIDAEFVKSVPQECRIIKIPPIDDRRLYTPTNTLNRAHKNKLRKMGFKLGLETDAGIRKFRNKGIGSSIRALAAQVIPIGILKTIEDSFYRRAIKDYRHLLNGYQNESSIFLSMDPVSCGSQIMSQCVKFFGGKAVLFFPNWKDLARGYATRNCYDQYFVWNTEMASDLIRQNPNLQPTNCSIVGTPQFELNWQFSTKSHTEECIRKLDLDESRPIILYTAASTRVIPHEGATIDRICKEILKGSIVNTPQLVIRTNPTGSDSRIESLPKRYPFVRISSPKWDFRPNEEGGTWQSTDPDDIKLYGSLLHLCAFGIGAPSTVVVDLANAGKRMLAVGFDPPDQPLLGQSVTTFSSQDIFRSALNSDAAIIANDPEDLVAKANKLLTRPRNSLDRLKQYERDQTGSSEIQSITRIAENLRDI